MELLFRVLASVIRRALLGAAGIALAALLARGLIDVELRDDIVRWLSGDAVSWIVTLLMTLAGVAWTALDKYLTRLKLQAAKNMPAGASDWQIDNHIRRYGGAVARLFVRSPE